MDSDDIPMDLGLHFSASQIIASLIFGVIGIYVFRLGKRNLNYPLIFVSIALMVYPMFTSGPLQDWGIGIGLCAVAFQLHKNANLTG